MNVLDPDEVRELLGRLVVLTREGQLRWQLISPHEFMAVLARHTLRIDSVDRDDAPPYRLSLFRHKADEPELLNSIYTDLDSQTDESSTINTSLGMLYILAMRSSRNLDGAMKEILEDLDELDRPF